MGTSIGRKVSTVWKRNSQTVVRRANDSESLGDADAEACKCGEIFIASANFCFMCGAARRGQESWSDSVSGVSNDSSQGHDSYGSPIRGSARFINLVPHEDFLSEVSSTSSVSAANSRRPSLFTVATVRSTDRSSCGDKTEESNSTADTMDAADPDRSPRSKESKDWRASFARGVSRCNSFPSLGSRRSSSLFDDLSIFSMSGSSRGASPSSPSTPRKDSPRKSWHASDSGSPRRDSPRKSWQTSTTLAPPTSSDDKQALLSQHLAMALKRSGSLARNSMDMQVLQTPDDILGAYFAPRHVDKSIPIIKAQVDLVNLLSQIPSGIMSRSLLSLQQVFFMSTDWLGIRLVQGSRDQCMQFAQCIVTLLNISCKTSRSVLVQIQHDRDDPRFQPTPGFACAPLASVNTFIKLAEDISQLACLIMNDIGLPQKKVEASVEKWCKVIHKLLVEPDALGREKSRKKSFLSLNGIFGSLEEQLASLTSDTGSPKLSTSPRRQKDTKGDNSLKRHSGSRGGRHSPRQPDSPESAMRRSSSARHRSPRLTMTSQPYSEGFSPQLGSPRRLHKDRRDSDHSNLSSSSSHSRKSEKRNSRNQPFTSDEELPQFHEASTWAASAEKEEQQRAERELNKSGRTGSRAKTACLCSPRASPRGSKIMPTLAEDHHSEALGKDDEKTERTRRSGRVPLQDFPEAREQLERSATRRCTTGGIQQGTNF